MTRLEGIPTRTSSTTTSSSTDTVKGTKRAASRRGPPMHVRTDGRSRFEKPDTHTRSVSGNPTSASTASPEVSPRDKRMSDFGNYRRDLSILDNAGGGRPPHIERVPPSAASPPQQIAPWMSPNATGGTPPASNYATSFYNDSNENIAPLSPGFPRPGTGRTGNTTTSDSPDNGFFNDERRPSVASVTTASSTGSKSSRANLHKKLQGFFGDDFSGKDGSETSLPSHGGKEHPPHAYARHRERNASTKTEDSGRDQSPAGSRPRTPVPSSDVVPFLYQDSKDISLYGEAPVRQNLSGLDKERYEGEAPPPVPPKTSSSLKSAASSKVHLPGHHHRHNKSTEDARSLKPTTSREDTSSLYGRQQQQQLRGPSSMATATKNTMRPKSPTPSNWSQATTAIPQSGAPPSPPNNNKDANKKGGIFNRFWRKDKDETATAALAAASLKNLPGSVRSLTSTNGQQNGHKSDGTPAAKSSQRDLSATASEMNLASQGDFNQYGRPNNSRQGTFNKLPFRKGRGPKTHDSADGLLESDFTEPPSNRGGQIFNFDSDLSNMDGILSNPPPLTPLDNAIFTGTQEEEPKPESAEGPASGLGWNAPDSWAVKKVNDDNISHLPEIDEMGVPPKDDKKVTAYSIRVFRLDGTYATLSTHLNATVTELINQLGKKSYTSDSLDNYQIIMRKHDLQRILGPGERPVVIQKRLLEQAGYEDRDKIEDVGREDNSYLCRFSFVPSRESGYATLSSDTGNFGRVQKYSHVDLSGRNLITIPIALYSKATEIISLNLSRNLSLDLPKDFIQSCLNLRDIKFINNEAWKLPQSLSRAQRLTILDVSNNRLEQLEHAELARLQGLVSLKLANNRVTHIPPYFGQFRAMRTLNISSNFLEDFPDFLCDLESLVDIDMSFNSISNLPENIGKLKSLERFVITNNRLSGSLPATFSQLQNLKEVDIRYNALSSIDVIAGLPLVEQISADHNSVSVFEGSFSKIRVLRLNSNPVTKFEITNGVPSLTTLILSNAKLAHIPDAVFDKTPNLVKLVLDKNHFVSLPSHIGKLRRLEHFSIARNALSSLPAEIGCLHDLHFLDVRENNLKKLPEEIWYARSLETLNVSSNVLDSFPKPGSRAPQVPGENPPPIPGKDNVTGTPLATPSLSHSTSLDELAPIENFQQRRPSQASGGLLSVGSSPVPPGPDRKSSLVSVYGKGGRKTSVMSRSGSDSTVSTPATTIRKDSGVSTKLQNTFAASLKNLYLADNQLDDDVFDELVLLVELRLLNLSYNDLNDIPQRTIKSWPQLQELYLSGNELTSLPSDDFEELSVLQVLHINGNKFQTLPAELGKVHRLTILDCGSNALKYNVSNWPYDWNWNWNTALRYLNLSGNKRLEIKPNVQFSQGAATRDVRDLTDFGALLNLRILGLMDVTLTIPQVPDQTEDRRVRTSGSLAGSLAYGMADTLGRNEHLSTIDMVVPRFNTSDSETLLGMFDGQALSSGGSKIAKYLHENFTNIFAEELKKINPGLEETPADALRRAFLSLNKELATAATHHTEERSISTHRGSAASTVLSQADLHSGGVATVMFLQQSELYVANVGDAQAMLLHSEGGHRMLTRKHDPAEASERNRIRDAGGWVSRQGKLNDILEVSRAFGYVQLMPAVQAAPHITQVTIKETDEMLLIASRELWEYLSPELVVDVARVERGDLMRAAQRLRDLAMAFGATGKIMVMILGVSDLKKRERYRLNRGTSMSMGPSGIPDEGYAPIKRGKRAKGEVVEDSMLRRLQAEVQAPVGDVSIVFTDIKNSTMLWENFPSAMRSAIKLHNEVMRRQLRLIGGYEVKTEGDAFMVSFPTPTSALLWCFSVQNNLLEVQWPSEVVDSIAGKEIRDSDDNIIFRGLSVRMGIHWGSPVCENDPVTRRMDYFGPMVNRAARISAVADGGQITVSADFISEIQRCLLSYSESDRTGSTSSDDTLDADVLTATIRKEMRSLSSQGFEVKDMGERKLKGLENPEYIYLIYPHALAGRITYQARLAAEEASGEASREAAAQAALKASRSALPVESLLAMDPAALSEGSLLDVDTTTVWKLWKVSLRLEQLCSLLEEEPGSVLQHPETELMERVKNRGGEVTDHFLLGFIAHLVSRVETCTAALQIRHIAAGSGPIEEIEGLRVPMGDVLAGVKAQMEELRRYRELYGPLPVLASHVDPAIVKNLQHTGDYLQDDAEDGADEDASMEDFW